MTQPSFFPQFDQPVRVKENPVKVEHDRRAGVLLKVLTRLQQGPATNTELSEITLRYGGAIFYLRQDGWLIEKAQIRGGLWRYTLSGMKQL